MSNAEKIRVQKREIIRFQKAQQSEFARHIDIANLLNARDKLRDLEQEFQLKTSN